MSLFQYKIHEQLQKPNSQLRFSNLYWFRMSASLQFLAKIVNDRKVRKINSFRLLETVCGIDLGKCQLRA